MTADPTADINIITSLAGDYHDLQAHLSQRQEETKNASDGKTAWRKACAEKDVDPVILAQAVEMMMKLEANPEKTTRHWRVLTGYLKGLGFFNRLEAGLFDDFEEQIAASAASDAS